MRRRLLGLVVVLVAAGFVLSGTASADAPWQNVDVVHGTCAATVLNGRGEPLVVDADALLVDEGLPGVRLGSSTDRKAEKEAVHLPVGDAVELLRLNDVPVVGDLAGNVCAVVDDAGGVVNAVGRAVRVNR